MCYIIAINNFKKCFTYRRYFWRKYIKNNNDQHLVALEIGRESGKDEALNWF